MDSHHGSPDLEKSVETVNVSSSQSNEDIAPMHVTERTGFSIWNNRIKKPKFLEERGITRVMPNERHAPSVYDYIQMVLLWFSANITANNLAVGLLGPLVFNLGFTDSALTAVFGVVVGSAATAYMSIWGAQSGNRTMVRPRSSKESIRGVAASNGYVDCGAILYGILAGKNRLLSEHCHHGWIWYN